MLTAEKLEELHGVCVREHKHSYICEFSLYVKKWMPTLLETLKERGERILELQREIGEMNQEEYNAIEMFAFCSHCEKVNGKLVCEPRAVNFHRLVHSAFIQITCGACGALLFQAKKRSALSRSEVLPVEYFKEPGAVGGV